VSHRPRILVILGPTASGKTALALDVARLVDGEIISADSRQAYRGLEIGTAAPTIAERAAVPHHGVAFLEPGDRYGAGRFARLCREWITDIESRGRTPIVVGGTGFFVRAVTHPVFKEPDLDSAGRAALEAWLSARPLDEIRRWTGRLDPDLIDRLPVLDRQRAGRALELALLTGRNLSWWQCNAPPEADPIPARTSVLEADAATLRRRINERTLRLLDGGWAQEVEALGDAGHGPGSPAMTSIGYRDVSSFVRGEISRERAVEAILRDTWAYARRQRTWLRHQVLDATRIDVTTDLRLLANRIAAEWLSTQAADDPTEEKGGR